MIYNCQNPVTGIFGIEHIKWNAGVFSVKPRDYSALAFRIKGDATITAGGKSYYLDSGDILYMPQNLAYEARYSDTELIVIHFRTGQDDPAPQVFSMTNAQQVYKAFLSAHTIWKTKAPGYTAYGISQFYHILGLLCEQDTVTKLPDYFLRAVSYIHGNFRDPGIHISVVCKNAGISATYLRTLFQQSYGKSPTQYITELRLEYARNLLSCGISVESAAQQSGFPDSKYFARVVKKHFGCTPSQLRSYGK